MGVTGKPSVRWDLSSGEEDMGVLGHGYAVPRSWGWRFLTEGIIFARKH